MCRFLVALLALACTGGFAAAADCDTEIAALSREEGELPRLDVVSPRDRPPYCITLETVIGFAGRLQAHVEHCPDSRYAPAAANWSRMRNDYSRLFARRGCRPTMRR
jgi:hypothetical protein